MAERRAIRRGSEILAEDCPHEGTCSMKPRGLESLVECSHFNGTITSGKKGLRVVCTLEKK